ncbi:MAG: fused MFS/spermidine synthase [Planctomycetes bacterium]|nr:fused MFS/spermidine synthase [Planctomycetota bacterium]
MRTTLLVTVFLSGGALMSLEMAGFRLVEPVYGSDISVWGSLISVFLGGLAVGAVLGGHLADRSPRLWKLGAILFLGGVVTIALRYYATGMMDWMYPGEGAPLPAEWGTGGSNLNVYVPPDLKWPTLWVSLMLFGPPTLLLGMVSPYAARLFVYGMPNIGADVGRLYGISTVGSIIGTLGTAFYLISWMGTRWILLSNGLLLVALGLTLAMMDTAAKRKAA